MSVQMFALLLVTIGFTALVTWTFWPGNKQIIEKKGAVALEFEEKQP